MPRNFNPNKPRCYLVYALAPESMPMREVDRAFNEFIGHSEYGLVLYHDHFIDRVGGVAIFWIENVKQLNALSAAQDVIDWKVNVHPLTFSDSGAGFLAQIEFTLKQYRNMQIADLMHAGKSFWTQPQEK